MTAVLAWGVLIAWRNRSERSTKEVTREKAEREKLFSATALLQQQSS